MKFTTIILFLLLAIPSSAQTSFGIEDQGLFKKNMSWLGSLGYTYQSQHLLEFGIKRTSAKLSKGQDDAQYILSFTDYSYFILGGELLLRKDVQMAPKAGIGYHFLFVNTNVNLITYNTDFKSYYPAIVPEIGLSIFGVFQINYGYNVYLSDPNQYWGRHHRISTRINFVASKKKRKN